MRRTSHKSPFAGIITRMLMLLSAFLLLLSYASMVVNPAKAWYMTILGLLFVPIAVLNGLFLIMAIKNRSSSFMIPLLALLPQSYSSDAISNSPHGRRKGQKTRSRS